MLIAKPTQCLLLLLAASASLHGLTAADEDGTSFTPAAVEVDSSGELLFVLIDTPRQVTAARATRMAALQEQQQQQQVNEAAETANTTAADDVVGSLGMKPVYQTILDRHNAYRARHQAGPLTWSDALASQAEGYAARCIFAHDPAANAGENLFAISDTTDPAGSLTQAIAAWYTEVNMYNFNNPGFSSATGHFTQVVWRGTTSLGCAVQSCNSGLGGTNWPQGSLVVCRYLPAGNVLGAFQQNVLPATANPPPAPVNPPAPNPPATPPPASNPPSNPSPGQVAPATLPAGYKFASPACLASVSQQVRLCVADDGYLRLYVGTPGTQTWVSTNSFASNFRPYKLTMKTDGNLVASDNLNRVLWQSGTAGRGVPPYAMVVQDNGAVVVLDGTKSAIWSTYTNGGGRK